jgi:pre-rRNA-processing protein RIX1
VVLIKAVVDVGGWEVLKGAESWVRGLLAILGVCPFTNLIYILTKLTNFQKPDPVASKRLCIIALTDIYLMTHQYQSLVREITTPTLPTFVSSCLNLVSPKASGKSADAPSSLVETIFGAFSILVPRHPTIFRPSLKNIRTAIRPFLAPTLCDRRFVTLSLSQNARRLAVLLHQTAPKNTSGEEWGKALRALLKDIHSTTDQVFRAILEDWESSAGYVSQPVDVNQEIHGGAKSEDDLPAWNGIDAGIERLVGQLELIAEYLKYQTATAVTIPLGIVVDLLTRLMSVAPPTNSKTNSFGSIRLHPAIERDEREGLWAGLSQVHSASMEIYTMLADRLQDGFTSLAQGCIDHVTWTFSSGQHDGDFRVQAYDLVTKVLPLCGPSLPKPLVSRMSPIIVTCCMEVKPAESRLDSASSTSQADGTSKNLDKKGSANADTFLQSKKHVSADTVGQGSAVFVSATKLLPVLLSYLPHQHLEGYLRAELDRAAVISRLKEGMLASVLNPYLGKNGKSFPSILPHLSREFSGDASVEALLRPRFPVIRQSLVHAQLPDTDEEELGEDETMEDIEEANEEHVEEGVDDENVEMKFSTITETVKMSTLTEKVTSVWGEANAGERKAFNTPSVPALSGYATKVDSKIEIEDEEEEEEDSDGSVHLEGVLSDSEGEDTS